MLDRLLSVIPTGNRRFPIKYMRMITSIKDRMVLAKNRYLLAHPIRTPAIEMFRYILQNLNLETLASYNSDVDRYTEYLKTIGSYFRLTLDPNFSNTIAGGRFIDRSSTFNFTPAEILLNCEFANPIKELPFDADWSEWETLRSIRIMYHDSLQIPEDFSKSTFSFTLNPPTHMIIAVNAPVLCFKYYKYLVDCKTSGMQPDVIYFLKQFEFAYFFDDLIDIFIMNTLQRVFSHPDDDIDQIAGDMLVPIRFCTMNMKRQGVEGIVEFVNLLRNGSIKPGDFLATHWFGNQSIMEKFQSNCRRYTALPNNSRYLWLRTLNDMPYLSMIIASVRSFPDGPLKDTFNNRCRELWNLRINPVSMPSSVTSTGVKDVIANWKSNLGGYLNGSDQILPREFRRTR